MTLFSIDEIEQVSFHRVNSITKLCISFFYVQTMQEILWVMIVNNPMYTFVDLGGDCFILVAVVTVWTVATFFFLTPACF